MKKYSGLESVINMKNRELTERFPVDERNLFIV